MAMRSSRTASLAASGGWSDAKVADAPDASLSASSSATAVYDANARPRLAASAVIWAVRTAESTASAVAEALSA